MAGTIAAQTARETVIAALRAAGKPQLPAEIRARIWADFGLDLHRDAIYTALVWLGDRGLVDYHEVPGSGSCEWRAVPATYLQRSRDTP